MSLVYHNTKNRWMIKIKIYSDIFISISIISKTNINGTPYIEMKISRSLVYHDIKNRWMASAPATIRVDSTKSRWTAKRLKLILFRGYETGKPAIKIGTIYRNKYRRWKQLIWMRFIVASSSKNQLHSRCSRGISICCLFPIKIPFARQRYSFYDLSKRINDHFNR